MNLIWSEEISSERNLHCMPQWKDHEGHQGNFPAKSIFSHTRDHVTSQRLMTSLTNNNRLQHAYMAAYNGSNNNNNKDSYQFNNIQQRGCHGNLQQDLFHASSQNQMYNYHNHHQQQQQHRHHQQQQIQAFQHHHNHHQLQQYYQQQQQQQQQQMATNQIQNTATEAEVTNLQDGDDNDDDDDDTIGHDLAGDDDDEEATETATLEERGLNKDDGLPMKADLKFNFSNVISQDPIGTIESKVCIKSESAKTSTDVKLTIKDLKSDSDYKHKLILAKQNLSSNSNSPVQSQQGTDLNQLSEAAQQDSSELLASPHKGPHLNQPIGMRLNIESSNHRHDGSPLPGPSRADDDCDLRPISDEDRDSTSIERRFRESDDDDDDDEIEKSRFPAIFPRMPHDNRKQCLNDHLLQKYMETYKNYPPSSSSHFHKQEPLDVGFPVQPTQEYPGHIQPGFGLDHALPNMFPFLPHPSLAQQQQHRQMMYEYSSRMKSSKEVKPANERRNVFCCHICSFVGSSEEDFNSHMSQHFEHQCPHCTYSSRTEGRLKRHIKDFHSNENDAAYSGQHKSKSSTPKRTCRYCKFYTYDQVEFWMHLKKHIKPEKLLECPHCEFVTELKHHLEYHIRVHIGSKPFKCPKCNYSCVNKSMLNSHMKSHTNVYQFRCRDCNYATKYSHSLKLHLLKKKHHADVVLNSDGSMPTDGSGQFDVVNRRGPPRGPRLVRTRPGQSYSPNSSSSELAQETRRLINQLDDLKARYGRDMNDTRLSLSPELMSGSRDASFVPKPQYGSLGANGLATSFSNYARMFSSQQYDCCFCPEKFPTSMLLKDHVEKFHFKTGFGMQAQQNEPTYNSNAAFQTCNNAKDSFETLKPKSEPIGDGFEDSLPREATVTPLDLSNGSKRKIEDADSRNTSSPFSEQGSSRKRARKGRAFKLDTRDSCGNNWQAEELTDSQIGAAKSSDDGDDNGNKRSRKIEDNVNNSDKPNDPPTASSSDDVIKTTTIKTSPQWKSDDATEMENSPKSDLSSEGLINSNEDQKQVPSSSSGNTIQQDKVTFSDLKVDSNWHMCRHCEMAFADQMTHRLHMGYHGYYNPFQCNGCGENCVDAFDFMLHLMCKAHK